MAYVAWVDRCIFNAASAGLGDFVVSSAVTGYLTPAQANASDQYRYRYAAQTVDGSGNIVDWEVGTGAYTVSTTTLARTTIEFSSNSNNKVNFATAPQVMVTALTGDFSSQLDADTSFYVATTGSDTTGNGTIGLPWKTLQKAYNTIVHFDLNGYSANIQIANGTYASVTMQLGNGSGTINFIGASAAGVIINPTAVLTGVAFQVGATNFTNLSIGIQDLTCSGTGIETGIVATGAGSVVSLYGDVFFTNLAKHIHAAQDSSVYALGSSITLTGNAATPFLIEDGSSFVNFCPSIVCVGTPAWSNAFAECNDGSLFETENVAITFTGAATGKRFIVENGSVINTGTNNLSYFPGDVAGDILAGGQYDSYGPRAVVGLNVVQNYYVSPTGNDLNDGLTVGTPFKTIQHAINVVTFNLQINLGNVRIQLADGVYDENINLCDYVGEPSAAPVGSTTFSNGIFIQGNYASPSNVKIQPTTKGNFAVVVSYSAVSWYFYGIEIDASLVADGYCDLVASYAPGLIRFDGCVFGGTPAAGGAWFDLDQGSQIAIVGINPCHSNGIVDTMCYGFPAASLLFQEAGIVFDSDPQWRVAAVNTQGGIIGVVSGFTFTGSVTGKKFLCDRGGIIYTPIELPGSIAGTCDAESFYNGLRGGPPTVDVIANILLLTPALGLIAYATDLGVKLTADGTKWNIDSSYYTAQTDLHDLGAIEFSNRIGYGKDYVTDKSLVNCLVGIGTRPGTISGQIRWSPTANTDGALQVYNTVTASWESIVSNLDIFEISGVLAHVPVGFTSQIKIFSGDSVLLGLNGLPIIQGYISSMGAYPIPQQLNGGTF